MIAMKKPRMPLWEFFSWLFHLTIEEIYNLNRIIICCFWGKVRYSGKIKGEVQESISKEPDEKNRVVARNFCEKRDNCVEGIKKCEP
jgi:hypothetical protein